VVGDGSSAMAAARSQLPDALIVDIGLPGLDGYALAHAVRQLAKGARVPTLLLAPDHVVVDGERVAYVGIDDVLMKPFERTALLARFEALFGPPVAVARTSRGARQEAPDESLVAARARSDVDGVALEARIGDAVQKRLPALVEAEVERRLDAVVRDALARIVDERLGPTFDRAVRGAVAELAEPARIDSLVTELLDARLDAEVRQASGAIGERLEASLTEEVGRFVRQELQKKLERQAEQVIWKIVPALAEDLIKEELKRLTEV